jgi:hypothetical protein
MYLMNACQYHDLSEPYGRDVYTKDSLSAITSRQETRTEETRVVMFSKELQEWSRSCNSREWQ